LPPSAVKSQREGPLFLLKPQGVPRAQNFPNLVWPNVSKKFRRHYNLPRRNSRAKGSHISVPLYIPLGKWPNSRPKFFPGIASQFRERKLCARKIWGQTRKKPGPEPMEIYRQRIGPPAVLALT